MTIDFHASLSQQSGRWIQITFFAIAKRCCEAQIAVLFNLCLVAQLLTVGLAVFYDPFWWRIHVWLVRGYGGLVVLLLAGLFVSPFPRKIQMLTGGMATLLILQFITIHLNHPFPLGILHPLIGFTLFNSSTTLVHKAWHVVGMQTEDSDAAPNS